MGAMEDSANGNAKRRFAVIATVPVNMGSCIGRATIRAGWLAVPTSLFEVLYARFLSGEFLKYLYNIHVLLWVGGGRCLSTTILSHPWQNIKVLN